MTTERIVEIRNLTLSTAKNKDGDARDGIKKTSLPVDINERERIEDIMRSTRPPYAGFKNYYDLDEVIDAYMDIWYDYD